MNYKKYQSKSLFIWGTIACIGLSSNVTALSNIDAGSLISSEESSQNKNLKVAEMSLKDVDTLREQLQKKTKELQDYKAKLFRPSHPEDQAKIIALSRRISEYERTKQLAIAEIQSLKNELQATQKQIQELEEFSVALHSLIEGQEALSIAEDAKKIEFMAKADLLERDWNLEKNLTNQLQAEMVVLKDLLELQEKQIVMINQQREEEFASISLQASLLKSEFDNELHLLKSEIAEIIARNEKLKNENDSLNQTTADAHVKIDQHHQERQSLALNLIEQEEALAKAKQDYESAKDEYAHELKNLSEELSYQRQDLALILHDKNAADESLEELKNRIDEIAAENLRLKNENDDLNNKTNDVLAKHDQHHQEMQSLALNLIDHEQALEQSRENNEKLKSEHSAYIESLTNELNVHRDNLSKTEEEKKALDQDLQNLKNQLDEIALEKTRLQNDNESLSKTSQEALAKHEEHHQERQSLALNLIELEEALNEAKQNHEKAKDEYAAEINRLTEELKQHEESILSTLDGKKAVDLDLEALKTKIDEISAQNLQLEEEKKALDAKVQETLAKHEEYLQEKDSLNASLSSKDEALKEAQAKFDEHHQERQSLYESLLSKDEALKEAQAKFDEHLQEKQALTATILSHEDALREASENHQHALDLHATEKERLASELKQFEEKYLAAIGEKEALDQELSSLRNKIEQTSSELLSLQNANAALNGNLSDAKSQYDEACQINQRLANEHQSLNSQIRELESKNAQDHQEKQSLAVSLLENEELLNQVKHDHEMLKQNHSEKIRELEQQLDEHKTALSTTLSEKDRIASLHEQGQDNFDTLSSEVQNLKNENMELARKAQEAEKAIQSLTVVAQQQDQALAKANTIFSMVQEYNGQLEQEIVILKDRLSESEAAHRKLQKLQESDNEVTETGHGVSHAIKKLINTVSGGA